MVAEVSRLVVHYGGKRVIRIAPPSLRAPRIDGLQVDVLAALIATLPNREARDD